MTGQEFHNKRVNLYSVLRTYQREGFYEQADKIVITIDKLEEIYFAQFNKELSA